MKLLFEWIGLVVVTGFFVGWAAALRRLARKQPVLPGASRQPAPWGLLDLLLATLLLMTFQLVNALVLTKALGIEPAKGWDKLPFHSLALLLFCEPAVNLAAIAIALAAIRLRTRARLADFGLVLRHVPEDLALGAVAFAMLAPPVYALQRLLTIWIPYEHPLISVLQKNPRPLLHVAVFFSAVVAAPIVEELFYRVLWQGWLQTFARRRQDFLQLVLGRTAAPLPAEAAASGPGSDGAADTAPLTGGAETAAILVSSAMFASMHFSQGAAPIPLFVLAVGLGYVYARTGRVLPCIVVHVLLNASSLMMLWLGADTGSPPS
jgi:membrane protease YdiL (CAAX protease family)